MNKETSNSGATRGPQVIGLIGVIMDVTELKEREQDVEEEAREKRQAIANEAAAKEANRLKSQFLANVSSSPLIDILSSGFSSSWLTNNAGW
jgi:signal transduction histidine kinase